MPDAADKLARWAPDLKALQDDVAALAREAEQLLELARIEHRRIQDYDAELEAGADGAFAGSVQVGRHNAAHRLRWIARRIRLAQAVLVAPGDERYAAAKRVSAWLEDAEAGDAPWRTVDVDVVDEAA
jgi:hypothetical protein